MNFVRRCPDINFLYLLKRCYNVNRKSHYEILKLQKNCSAKDIKEAFIKLSKEYHPDKNKDVNAQEKFVRILEAYNVLSKPNSRSQYDSMSATSRNPSYAYRPPPNYNPQNQYKSAHTGYSYYYGKEHTNQSSWQQKQQAPANKTIPNMIIILMCLGFAFVGFILQIAVIRQSFVMNKRRADEKSRLAGEELERVRAAAHANGNELQSRLLLDKIAAGSNPAVATASLGAALANEQK